MQVVVDSFEERGAGGDRVHGYTLAEINAATADRRSHVPADRLQRISDWTIAFSDHVSVTVRFVTGENVD